jgi:hypothetical protein
MGRPKTLFVVVLLVAALNLVFAMSVTAAGSQLSQNQFDSARQLVQADDQNFASFSVDWSSHTLKVYRVASRIGSSGETGLTRRLEQLAASNDRVTETLEPARC